MVLNALPFFNRPARRRFLMFVIAVAVPILLLGNRRRLSDHDQPRRTEREWRVQGPDQSGI